MAFIRKKSGSKFWYAGFYREDGKRAQVSTKTTDRKEALRIARELEDAHARKATVGQIRTVLSGLTQRLTGEALPSKTAREFLTGWAEARKRDTSPRTAEAYGQVSREFLASLGPAADRDITQITRAQVADYRDKVLERTSIATANKALKYLRIPLGQAVKDGLLERNPAQQVDVIRRAPSAVERRPFTLPEIKRLLDQASEEWKSIILFGFYSGQRLGDIVRLTWHSIDLAEKTVRFVTKKTGRRMSIPLAEPLAQHLESLASKDDPAAPLFPEAYKVVTRGKDLSRLSQQFHELLVAANLAAPRLEKDESKGVGRGARRELNEISFHSLRHSATSLLKVAGVPEAVAMDIIGHDSRAISRAYTHVEDRAKRAAVNKLPAIQ